MLCSVPVGVTLMICFGLTIYVADAAPDQVVECIIEINQRVD